MLRIDRLLSVTAVVPVVVLITPRFFSSVSTCRQKLSSPLLPRPESQDFLLPGQIDPQHQDILIACVEGLKGFPEAIETIYPHTEVQLCVVHLVQASLNYVPWKHRKLVAADLRRIYQAGTAEEARQQLEEMILKWTAYPSVGQVWQRNWDHITPFFRYPETFARRFIRPPAWRHCIARCASSSKRGEPFPTRSQR